MLVVRVEEWPAGDPDKRRPIARIDIANRSQLADLSTYEAILRVAGASLADEPPTAIITRHRRADGWLPLVVRATQALYEQRDDQQYGSGLTWLDRPREDMERIRDEELSDEPDAWGPHQQCGSHNGTISFGGDVV